MIVGGHPYAAGSPTWSVTFRTSMRSGTSPTISARPATSCPHVYATIDAAVRAVTSTPPP